jgi:hypothetical protein
VSLTSDSITREMTMVAATLSAEFMAPPTPDAKPQIGNLAVSIADNLYGHDDELRGRFLSMCFDQVAIDRGGMQ